jgi:hypothetical protein
MMGTLMKVEKLVFIDGTLMIPDTDVTNDYCWDGDTLILHHSLSSGSVVVTFGRHRYMKIVDHKDISPTSYSVVGW